ncbi:Sporulation kinase A [Sporotomaculum syntrophicum]|uniref:histidine kinase n=1 Tax=Sporotomaculum syntrophicum TaxID=182264 RepID=A0A9D2WM72_9FIRM|nr:MEDS domain-containing protein [Sporotomaculum syntrophicum]KAF1083768.1 Sporulation kinase A [Sporotomaculum syntrophicum]
MLQPQLDQNLRKIGIDYIQDVPWGTHICGFYHTKIDLINTLVPYFKAGLENNEFCIWVASEPVNCDEAKLILNNAVPNFKYYLQLGQIEFLTHSEWYFRYGNFKKVVNSWVDKINQTVSRGFDGIRICGNTSWLKKRYWKSFQEYEALIEQRIGELRMVALYTYELDKCNIQEIFDIVSNHQFSFIISKSGLQHIDSVAKFDRLNLISKLASSIAHEIRNPMTSVRGFLQLLQTKSDFDSYSDYFNVMLQELDRANGIINEFLSLARNNNISLKRKNINDILNLMQPLIQADALKEDKSFCLELEEIPDLFLDENEIRQVILNLTRNGLEAMLPGGTLTVRTYIEDKEVVLEVQDQGTGIEHKLIDNIGSPFFTTKENGTGMGLAVCFSIAERNNASINFKTGPEGTTFYVRFKTQEP